MSQLFGFVTAAVAIVLLVVNLGFRNHEKPFNAHGEAEGGLVVSAEAFQKAVVPSAAAYSALSADITGDKLKNGLIVIVKATDNAGVYHIGDI